MLDWQFARFDDLPIRDWYAVSTARVDVFVMEQNCPFQDNDGADIHSWHLLGWQTAGGRRELAAYCRIVDAGIKFAEPSIGRVVTPLLFRRNGYGKVLMAEAVRRHESLYPRSRIGSVRNNGSKSFIKALASRPRRICILKMAFHTLKC